MRLGTAIAAVLLCCGLAPPAQGDTAAPASVADQPTAVPAAPSNAGTDYLYVIRYDHWSEADERGFGEFITAIGNTQCATVDSCLHDPANPFRASDPQGVEFRSDCADLPYVLRFYYAWKRGLPFGYVNLVEPVRHATSATSAKGNAVVRRRADCAQCGRQRQCHRSTLAWYGLVGHLSHPSRSR